MELLKWCRVQWDRALAVITGVAGVILVLAGWVGVSDTPFIAEQVPYVISYGLGGLVLIVVGATLWLSADLNDEWRLLDRMQNRRQTAELDALTERVRELEARTLELTRTS